MASGALFPLSILSSLLVQIGHIWLVLVLYKLLEPVNKDLAKLMVIFMLVSIPITMLSELNQFGVGLLLSGADYLAIFTATQLNAMVPLFLDLYENGMKIAFIFWGLWLFPMGYLFLKSSYIPRILGALLIVACFGYLLQFVAFNFFPSLGSLGAFMTIGEFPLLPLWLLIKGVDVEQWEKRVLESA